VKPKKKKREPKTKLRKIKCGSKKGRPKEENFVKKQVSLSIQQRLAVVPARHPGVVTNRKDKGVAVPQIVHSQIHVAFQIISGPG
jgi:hypothetical protein